MELVFILLIWEFILIVYTILDTSLDYMCPSFITLIMFMLSTISLIFNFDNWNIDFSITTFAIMISGLTTVVITETIVRHLSTISIHKKVYINIPRLHKAAKYGCIINEEREAAWISGRIMKGIVLLSSLIMMIVYISDILLIGNSLNLTSMISAIGAVKQSGSHTTIIATLCLRIGYALAGLYGFIFWHNVIISEEKVGNNIYLLISELAGLISSFFSGSRGMLLGLIFSFIFYFVTFSRIKKGWRKFKIGKYLKYIFLVGILFLVVFYFSRSLVKNRKYTSGMFEYITYYLGNSQQLLNLFVSGSGNPFPIDSGFPGIYTFQFLYNELDGLGLISLPESISSGFLYLNEDTLVRGNVYTMFGEPYHDFGFFGMLIFIVVFYFLFSYFYYFYIRNWRNTLKYNEVLLVFGSQYYLVFFTFYLAPTVWIKMQTIVTIFIVLIVYRLLLKFKFII